jgi:N-hydroxyarylamine O-acetyltransferase
MSSKINLTAYFNRIGYEGSATANLETLRKLHLLHTQTIPFENLNPLLGIPVKLDIEFLQQKLVHDMRGGYCFEQNLLFSGVLKTIGFEVEQYAGRVIWNQPEDKITSQTHMVLLVTIGSKKYHVDVGFGGQSPTGPLLFELDKVQETPNEPYRLVKRDPGYYVLQAKIKNEWKHLYRFTHQPQFWIDYKVANWYTSTHPDSHFVTDLIAARAAEGCRYNVHNNKLVTHYPNRESEYQPLGNADEIRDALENVIGLNLPKVDSLTPTLERLCIVNC